MTDMPSSADVASTTSTPRSFSSSTSVRAARPSAVAVPSSSSTTSALRLIRLILRWIIRLLLARLPSTGCHPLEICARCRIRLAAAELVDVAKLGRGEDLAQRAIDQEPEIVVIALDRERVRLLREQPVEHEQVRRRRVMQRAEDHVAIAEEDVDVTIAQGLDAGLVARHCDGF